MYMYMYMGVLCCFALFVCLTLLACSCSTTLTASGTSINVVSCNYVCNPFCFSTESPLPLSLPHARCLV